jgi:protein-disulfide isomerase
MRARPFLPLLAVLLAVPLAAQVAVGPVRLQVDASDDPSIGPAGAPVTIVEFCDFQCPSCAQLSPTLRRLAADFPGEVRVVFRDFPLDSHPDADRAAEAASCAGEQGRYWQMHDVLYANRADLSDPALRRYALASGADVDRFMTCFNSGRQAAEWREDRADGTAYGVTATPTFFVNGLAVEGVPTYAELAQLVRQEMGR